jgi:serine/threonine-protein kinase
LDEAEAGYRQDALPEADAALRQAEGLLASAAGTSEPLVQRVRLWRADLTMVARLEEIRLNREGFSDSVTVRGNAELDYPEAFRRYGLDVQVLDPAVAAGRIRASTVRNRLLAALDDWALSKRVDFKSGGERLLAITLEADPDPWRDRLRKAIARKDTAALAELARDKQAMSQALTTVLLLGQALEASGQSYLAVEVLRHAHPRYAGNFWMNYNLGSAEHLYNTKTNESVSFLRAAVALRPGSPHPRLDLALALERQFNHVAAEVEFRELVRMTPDFADAHHYLGVTLQANGKLDEAVAEYREAIRLASGSLVANSAVGKPRGEKGPLDESIAAYEVAIRLAKDQVHRARVYEDIGGTYACNGGLAEAAAAFHRSVECDPANHQAWCMAASMDIVSGDVKAYRRTCGQMLERFGRTLDPQVAERTAATCCLAPGATDDFAIVEELAERAVRGNEKHELFYYFAFAKALAEFRAGNDAEAIKWVRRFPPEAGGTHWEASRFSILAMANHRLGNAQDAMDALHEAQAIMSAKMPDPSKGRPFEAGNWRSWLPCQILYREAETLLKEPRAGAKPSQVPAHKSRL